MNNIYNAMSRARALPRPTEARLRPALPMRRARAQNERCTSPREGLGRTLREPVQRPRRIHHARLTYPRKSPGSCAWKDGYKKNYSKVDLVSLLFLSLR